MNLARDAQAKARAAGRNLLARLEKELVRAEAGTVATGGITKAGNDLEVLLRAIVVALDLPVGPGGVPRGPGSYLVVINQNRTSPSGDPFVDDVVREARKHRNRLEAMKDIRNANDHPGTVNLRDAKNAMSSLSMWLRGLLERYP
jgi:hypothetical protein